MSISTGVHAVRITARPQRGFAVASALDPTVTIVRTLAEAEAAWRWLEARDAVPPFQRYDWVRIWLEEIGTARAVEPLIAIGRRGPDLVFLWPLMVAREGAVRVGRWLGDRNANYNPGLYAPGERVRTTRETIAAALDEIARSAAIDCYHLERQPRVWAGCANALATIRGSVASPSNGHVATLAPSFEQLLARHPGSHRRKRMRQRERHFETSGDYRISTAATTEEAASMLAVFLEQKARRFAEMGVPNVFASAGVAGFLRRMATEAGPDGTPLLRLHALWAAGRVRAVAGTATAGDSRSILFLSFANDELARFGPGTTLVYRLVENGCKDGLAGLDFGVGEEPYKENWCDQEIELVETLLPVTLKGHAFAAAARAALGLKRAVKRNPAAWKLYRQLRLRTAPLRRGPP